MTDDEKALHIGRALMEWRQRDRIRQAVVRDTTTSDEARQEAREAEQRAYDRWLDARDMA